MSMTDPDPRLGRAAQEFIKRQPKMLIDGKLVHAASGETFPVHDPAKGEAFVAVPAGDAQDIDRAVVAARRAFDEGHWPAISPSERGKLIWKLADLLERHRAEFAELESIDNGKPVSIAQVADVPASIDQFRYMAGWATKIDGSVPSISARGDFHSYVLREPVGVVGQIVPWNFPLLMAAWKIAPALAAGCTVVLKTAEQTPLTALRLGELILEAGFPDGVVNIVTGFGETAGAALVAHELVDKVAFTGSTEVGKLILRAAAGNLKRVTLELGGKGPVIVFPDADLKAVIRGAADSIFFNSGQTCAAGSVLYAHERVFDAVVAGIAGIARSIRIGPGLAPDSQFGPLVSEEQFERVLGYIDAGRSEGARVVVGGERNGDVGYFVRPTVLTNTHRQMRVVREEIFGPVLVAQSFSDADLDRIAKQVNDTSYGLAASIWTRDLAAAHKLARKIRCGSVWINSHDVFDPSLPFGGYKQSGWGRENGREALHNYLETKAVSAAL
jgi:phenylacetaldehyde dehydrogenase